MEILKLSLVKILLFKFSEETDVWLRFLVDAYSRDSEDEIWWRFLFELVIWPLEATLARWTQPSGPLCHWQCFCSSLLCWVKDDLPGQLQISTFSIAKNEYHHVQLYYEDVEDQKEEGAIMTGRALQLLTSLNSDFMDIGANLIRRHVSPKIKPWCIPPFPDYYTFFMK